MNRIFNSITMKICFTILITETVLLSVMGIYYINRFWNEIDGSVTEKLDHPGILMEQRALNFEAVTDFSVLEGIIQERISDAFIAKKDGKIFYSKDPSRIGQHYTLFLDKYESSQITAQGISTKVQTSFTSTNGNEFWSSFSPLKMDGRLLGILYIKINSEEINKRKKEILYLFLLGSVLTIILTTLLEGLFVHQIFVPRINRTSSTLKKVEDGDLTVRITKERTPDQLGLLAEQVNSMISTIEQNTYNLRLLNKAGEAFSEASSTNEIENVSIEIMEEFIPSPLTKDEKNNLRQLISSSSEDISFAGKLLAFVEDKIGDQTEKNYQGFIQTLNRFISNSLKREQAQEKTKKAEAKYRDLFASAAEGIFRSNRAGQVLIANPSLARMFGYDCSEEIVLSGDNTISEYYLNPEDRTHVLEQLALEGKVTDREIQFRRKDDSHFWASLSAHAIKNNDGDLSVIEGRIIDISERKQREKAERDRQIAEATSQAQVELLKILEKKNEKLKQTLTELQSTQKQLVQSEKMTAVGMTAGGVAHDLNNILSGVINYPELVLMKLPKDSEFRKPLKAIIASGKRAAAVVADLLTLSRDVARTQEIISLNSLIEEYLNSAEFEQVKSNFPDISISTHLSSDLFNISCSTTHIQKIIMNLVINALEAVKNSGGIIITTENKKCMDAEHTPNGLAVGDYAVMNVIDDGPGINDEDLIHVFEPFYTKKIMGRSGTGLGLTVVWNALEEHRGTIIVDNKNKGTGFSVYLPATRKKVPELIELTSLDDLSGEGTILVVDDDELQRDVATKMLDQLGYSVTAVDSGEKALARLRQYPSDLVFLDMLMPPGINGCETYEEIIKLYPDQKAIIASGFSENEDVKKALRLGVRSFLKKPYTMEQLGKIIRDVLTA